jgi:hypothetical protein
VTTHRNEPTVEIRRKYMKHMDPAGTLAPRTPSTTLPDLSTKLNIHGGVVRALEPLLEGKAERPWPHGR